MVTGVELVSGSGQLEKSVSSTRVVVMGDIDWVSNGMLEDIPSNALFASVVGLVDGYFRDHDPQKYRTDKDTDYETSVGCASSVVAGSFTPFHLR